VSDDIGSVGRSFFEIAGKARSGRGERRESLYRRAVLLGGTSYEMEFWPVVHHSNTPREERHDDDHHRS
jgi:hypothetical protein